ncbi:MAG: aminotransferase class V-fold PLP-dependent enzyme [Emergencia sp.]|nr:aminotransferase class V-fold PLP-dependent enzyme [Emergencia sp.]
MIYLNNMEKMIHKPAAKDLDPVSPEQVKELLAKLLHCKRPENIYLTDSGRAAIETALRAFVPRGAHVIVSAFEQADVLKVLSDLECRVSSLEADYNGRLQYDKLENLIEKDTCAIVCAHGCSFTGNVADLEKISSIGRTHKIPVISDGRLTAGAIDVNLENLGVDIYCITSEKMLMGSCGVGAICLRDGMDAAMQQTQKVQFEKTDAPQQRALKTFVTSLEFILETGIYGIAMLPHRLAKRFFESSKAMNPVKVYGDYGPGDRLPVICITAEGFTGEEIRDYMKEKDIIIGVERGVAQFSFGYFNTRPQVKKTVLRLLEMLEIDDPYLLP